MSTTLTLAESGAQLATLVLLVTAAIWYAAPWLASRERAAALTPLLWVQVFRYVALQAYSARASGFPISEAGADGIVLGDVAGAIIAFLAILALRHRSRLAVPLAWVLVLETVYDTVDNIRTGVREHLMGGAGGVTWMILVFYVPLVIVSLGLIAWQLAARRGEALAGGTPQASRLAAAR